MATVYVELSYEDLNERPVERPGGYPGYMIIPGMNSAQEVTDDLVVAMLVRYLRDYGLMPKPGVSVCWSAKDDLMLQAGLSH